ncbi:MAG TPA: hypothetical protein VFM05_01200, partial [Candidatus Saccharimonadales bacterium]|nr:hypothetical protein [Candidatus Saccharimonadales bacterium]
MRFLRPSIVAMIGLLLSLSTTFAQVQRLPPSSEDPSTWPRFSAYGEKFEVLMPGTPVLKQEAHSISGQQLLLSYYGLTRGPSDYAVVTLSGFNVPNWDVAHMLMLDLYRRFNVGQTEQSSSSFKATFQKDISLNGYAGRQFSLEADNRVGVWRIYEVNKTFYAVGGSSNSTYTYALRRFFESFSLSEDKPTVVSASKTEEKRAPKTEEKVASNPTGRWLIILQTFS